MKTAFSLLELIFVIVLIGIVAGIGSSAFGPRYLQNDINHIVAKIRQTQYEGIGFDHRNFGGGTIVSSRGCMGLSKAALEDDGSEDGVGYRLHVNVDASAFPGQQVCFDTKGSPHDGDPFNGHFTERKVLRLTYRSQEVNLTIEPKTGYVTILY